MIKKVFHTGNIYEIYTFDKYFSGHGGKRERKKFEMQLNNDFNINYKNHCVVRLNMIRRIATANFNNNSKFITLTFDDSKVNHDIKDVKACNYEFKKFIKRLKFYLKQDIKYLSVIEFQDLNGRRRCPLSCTFRYFFY